MITEHPAERGGPGGRAAEVEYRLPVSLTTLLLPVSLLSCVGNFAALQHDTRIAFMVAGPHVLISLPHMGLLDRSRSRAFRAALLVGSLVAFVGIGLVFGLALTDLLHAWAMGLAMCAVIYLPYLRRTGGAWFPRGAWDVLALVGLCAAATAVALAMSFWPAWSYPVEAVWQTPWRWGVSQFVELVFAVVVLAGLATPPAPTYSSLRHPRALPLYFVACLACLVLPYALPQYRLDWLLLLSALILGITLTPRLAGLAVFAFSIVHVGNYGSLLSDLTRGGILAPGNMTQLILAFGVTLMFMLVAAREQMARLGDRMRRAAADDSLDAEFLTSLMHRMTDGVLLTDADGAVIMSNPAARAMLGRAKPAGEGGGWLAAYGVRSRDGATLDGPDLERLLRPGPEEETTTLTVSIPGTQGADERFYAVTARPLPQDGCHLIVISDTTAEHLRYRELESFAGTVAHDLSTPLTSLSLWVELAEADLSDAPHDALDALEHAHQSSVRMRDLIDDYLAYTVTREGMLSPEQVDLAEIVRDVAALYGEGPDAPTIAVELSEAIVQADRALATQLIANLVANSVKYARPGEPAQVVVRAVPETDPEWLRVQVADRGQGLDEADLTRIFKPFARSQGTAGSAGIGLGLALCQAIVTRHRGEIVARNNAWGGATIEFTLPRDTAMAYQI